MLGLAEQPAVPELGQQVAGDRLASERVGQEQVEDREPPVELAGGQAEHRHLAGVRDPEHRARVDRRADAGHSRANAPGSHHEGVSRVEHDRAGDQHEFHSIVQERAVGAGDLARVVVVEVAGCDEPRAEAFQVRGEVPGRDRELGRPDARPGHHRDALGAERGDARDRLASKSLERALDPRPVDEQGGRLDDGDRLAFLHDATVQRGRDEGDAAPVEAGDSRPVDPEQPRDGGAEVDLPLVRRV